MKVEKCQYCRAPVGRTDGGKIRFDSSRYHMDAVKKLSEISALKAYVDDLQKQLEARSNFPEVSNIALEKLIEDQE